MNHKKLWLVGFVAAFVAILTSFLGVTGTVIGSVISSVLYNALTEALEQPVTEKTFSHDFEWDIAYAFPLAVIALIELLLILALLSEGGILPYSFLSAFLSLQHLANNNLYRILGFAMLILSVYPFVLTKNKSIKNFDGVIIALVGVVFLARGFVDLDNAITDLYSNLFVYFDFPIAIISLLLILYVIYDILSSAHSSEKEFRGTKKEISNENIHNSAKRQVNNGNIHNVNNSSKPQADDGEVSNGHNSGKRHDLDYEHKKNWKRLQDRELFNRINQKREVRFGRNVERKENSKINKSSDKIQFESNDLLNEKYKK